MSLSLARDTYKGIDMKWMATDSGRVPEDPMPRPRARVRSSSPTHPILMDSARWCADRAQSYIRGRWMPDGTLVRMTDPSAAAERAVEDHLVERGPVYFEI